MIQSDGGGLAVSSAPQPPFMETLNPRQREAVECLDGPLLVLAGAGSGKTKTLTARAAHLIRTGRAFPSQILAVTFTNRAAREMRQRVEGMAGLKAETLPWLGTFHSICARLLRRHAELAGLTQRFTILDTDDQQRLLRQIIKAEGIDEKRWPARQLAALIDGWKNKCLLPGQLPASDQEEFNQRGAELYSQYQRRLKDSECGGFWRSDRRDCQDLPRARRCFGEILPFFSNTYLSMSIRTQTQPSIFGCSSWRGVTAISAAWGMMTSPSTAGAAPKSRTFCGLSAAFPAPGLSGLNRITGRTAHILAAASAVIAHNRGRLGKTLWTAEQGGDKLRVIGCMDPHSEARWIAGEIENLSTGSGPRPPFGFSEIAVLVRAAFQMREIEDRFLAIGLPYRVIGGPRFYERREIRDALAYFRLAVSEGDDLAFERIVNTPKRGVGEKGQALIQIEARESGISLLQAARSLLKANAFKGRAAAGLRQLSDSIDRWSQFAADSKSVLEEAAGTILDESGLPDMWKREKTPESEGRLENLKELVKSMKTFDNMAGFLEHVSLVYENLEDTESSKVSLMTLHAAKGLEFPAVFLPGWEEDVFPTRRAVDENPQGVEEERRLAYVGITRAERRCYISFCATRFLFGEGMANHPSRFVEELPARHVEVLTPPGLFGTYQSQGSPVDFGGSQLSLGENTGGYHSPGFQRMMANSRNRNRNQNQRSSRADAAEFQTGERVFSLKFGYGEIVAMSDDKLQIEFEQAGSKRIVASHIQKADGSEG